MGDKMKADIEKMKKNLDKLANEDGEEDEVGDDDDENKEEEKVSKSKHQYKDAHDSKKMNRRYKRVYDAILKKFEHRITLQQLMMFLRSFRRWLESNEVLANLFAQYEAAEKNVEDEDAVFHLEEHLKKTKIGSY